MDVFSQTFDAMIKKYKKYNFLICEDSELGPMMVSNIKQKDKEDRLNITLAVNGAESLEFLKSKKFDMVIMDNQMPFLSGSKVLKAFFSNNHEFNTKKDESLILIHTSCISSFWEDACEESKDLDYVSKGEIEDIIYYFNEKFNEDI